MKITERSFYSESSFRPKTQVFKNEKMNLFCAATIWGKPFDFHIIFEKIENYILTAEHDNEVTSPFLPISSYSKYQNILRISCLMLNEYILKYQNSDELMSGVEIFLCLKADNQLYFLNYGQPNVIFYKENITPVPLSFKTDYSVEFNNNSLNKLPTLPKNLLGIHSHIDFIVETYTISENDSLLLISKSSISLDAIANQDSSDFFKKVKDISNNSNESFWISILNF